MKQRTILFEITCIALLLLLGFFLSSLGIDNTGILSVAGLLSAFFLVTHPVQFAAQARRTLNHAD